MARVTDEMNFRLFMSEDKLTMVEMWADGVVRVLTRPEPDVYPDTPIIVTGEDKIRTGRREE